MVADLERRKYLAFLHLAMPPLQFISESHDELGSLLSILDTLERNPVVRHHTYGRERWHKMTQSLLPPIFTIEIDSKPTVAFEASNLHEAFELCREDWLRADLTTLNSNGIPLCSPRSKLRARIATDPEIFVFRDGAAEVPPSDDILLVYLVELDGNGAANDPVDPGASPPKALILK